MKFFSDQRRLEAARDLFRHIGASLDVPLSVRLWDGSTVPLGTDATTDYCLRISGPGVLGALMRRPSFENLLRHYARGHIDIEGDLIDFARFARQQGADRKARHLDKRLLLKYALPLLFAPAEKLAVEHQYAADAVGRRESRRDNKAFVQFHYDIGNAFYALFLDPEMQYSCGYFTHEDNSLDQAQRNKLEMICRKLRLQPGERLLDIGCGWGGLVCYAAQHYGVRAHGVTLSREQYQFARDKIGRLGLEDRVSVEIRDYAALEGTYDKVVSVGMFEHIGIANMPGYFKKIRSLLHDRGILLNHGISRRAKPTRRAVRRVRPERRLLLKYIFPGSELDNVGHTIDLLEIAGFEVHDLDAWRQHYALTTRHWYRRLVANREQAVQLVGTEKFRMWALYLAGVSLGFHYGSMHICQVLATKSGSKGPSGLPLTRADLYG